MRKPCDNVTNTPHPGRVQHDVQYYFPIFHQYISFPWFDWQGGWTQIRLHKKQSLSLHVHFCRDLMLPQDVLSKIPPVPITCLTDKGELQSIGTGQVRFVIIGKSQPSKNRNLRRLNWCQVNTTVFIVFQPCLFLYNSEKYPSTCLSRILPCIFWVHPYFSDLNLTVTNWSVTLFFFFSG